MTKSELIELIASKQAQLSAKDVELAVKTILEHMSQTLATGERIEIRGFGSFNTSFFPTRIQRNPKTGERIVAPPKHVVRFKPGRELRRRVNAMFKKNEQSQINEPENRETEGLPLPTENRRARLPGS